MLYAITADYRPKNPNKPIYYVMAKSRREAKQKFQNMISWLKVYDIKELNKDESNKIITDGPLKHIMIK